MSTFLFAIYLCTAVGSLLMVYHLVTAPMGRETSEGFEQEAPVPFGSRVSPKASSDVKPAT